MMLTIGMLVGQEQYAAVATMQLRLAARAYTPLILKIDCPPVELGQISVASEGQGNWLDLVKRFGLLDAAIRKQVADITNQHIRRSQRRRRIDLRKLIAEFAMGKTRATTTRTGRVKRAPRRGQAAPSVTEQWPNGAA